jgi:hypothetical protein
MKLADAIGFHATSNYSWLRTKCREIASYFNMYKTYSSFRELFDMKKEVIITLFSIATLHMLFVLLTFNADLLASLSAFCNPLILHRLLILIQFLPLVFTLALFTRRFKHTLPLSLAFATVLNTAYILDDLSSGFYGALLDYKSGIVPRMRISAHIKVYNDTGHLIALDPHGESPLEYLTAFFIAKISNINYILVYWYIIRLVNVTLWLTLFLITYKYLKGQGASCIWQLVNICALLMSSQTGYNYEVGLAMPFFLLLFLIGTKRGKASIISALLIASGIIMTSFNIGTVDLALVSLVGLSLYGISKFILHRFKPIEGMQCISTPVHALLILALTRIVIITTISYFGNYLATFLSIVNSFIRVMLEGS